MGIRKEIEKVLNDQVRPMLSMDGGSIDLVEVNNDGVVKVRLTGACCGCPGAQMTLSGIVESTIKSNVPGVSRVEMV